MKNKIILSILLRNGSDLIILLNFSLQRAVVKSIQNIKLNIQREVDKLLIIYPLKVFEDFVKWKK